MMIFKKNKKKKGYDGYAKKKQKEAWTRKVSLMT